jgi:hypothetical protein
MRIQINLVARVLLLGLLLLTVSQRHALAENVPKKIDIQQAKLLVYEVLEMKPDGSLDYDIKANYPTFFYFQGLGPEAGSYGAFAVNYWTGDIWDLWGCRRITSALLRKSQAHIRSLFTKDERKEYPRLHSLKPECLN